MNESFNFIIIFYVGITKKKRKQSQTKLLHTLRRISLTFCDTFNIVTHINSACITWVSESLFIARKKTVIEKNNNNNKTDKIYDRNDKRKLSQPQPVERPMTVTIVK